MALPQWLAGFFDELPEPRVERTRRYPLTSIVSAVLVGIIVGCRGWGEIHDFLRWGPPELRALFGFRRSVPCADTLRRVMLALDPKAFQGEFIRWTQALCQSTAGKLVAVDGKTVRGARRDGDDGPLHLVNAWVADNAVVLGQYATDVKSNEITAIPELLKLLDLRGCIVSIDAMGCQKKIAAAIIEQGADYLFGLKGNQPSLHEEVLGAFDAETCEELESSQETFHESVDKAHGRLEVRRAWVLREVDWLEQSDEWPRLKALVLIESTRTSRGTTSCEKRAYISSLDAPAERMSGLVRGHWSVENQLHWTLDVTFGEDRARISRANGAENLALVRKMALTLLKGAPVDKKDTSIVARQRHCHQSVDYLLAVLASGAPH